MDRSTVATNSTVRRGRGALLMVVLAAATAVALLLTAQALLPASRGESTQPSDSATRTARDFYAAVDQALSLGDTSGLERLLAPDFQSNSTGGSVDREGFLSSLRSLRTSVPGFELTVDDAISSAGGGEVTVRLSSTGSAGEFLGIPVEMGDLEPGWGALEVLDVRDGKVTGRLSGVPAGITLDRLAGFATAAGDAAQPALIALVRLTLPGDSRITIANGLATRSLYVDEGTVHVEGRTVPGSRGGPPLSSGQPVATPAPTEPIDAIDLADGALIPTMPGAVFDLSNPGRESTTVLIIVEYAATSTIADLDADISTLDTISAGGVLVQTLASARVLAAPGGAIGLGRASIPGSGTWEWRPGEIAVLAAIESGVVTVSISGGDARANGVPAFPLMLHAAEGVAIPGGAGARLVAAEGSPARVLILTVTTALST